MPEFLLFSVEIRRFLEEPRNAVIFPAAVLVPLLSLWPYFSSPLVPAIAAAFACTEPQYMNMWYLWPGLLEGMAIRPVRWHRVVAVKNITALALTTCVYCLFAIVTLYAHAGRIPSHDILAGGTTCIVAGFGVAMFGNNYAVVKPRARIGWTLQDLAAAVLIVGVLGATAIPFVVFSSLFGTWKAHGMLFAAASLLWVKWSIPNTASLIAHSVPEPWTNTTPS